MPVKGYPDRRERGYTAHAHLRLDILQERQGSASIDAALERVNRLLVSIEEAQELSNPRKTSMFLAYIFDTYHGRVTFFITGSAVGVMKSILDPEVKGPMFGRAILEMEVGAWKGKLTPFNFLKEGCRQDDFECREDEISEAVDRLEGFPGWLTLYGFNLVESGKPGDAMKKTVAEGMRIVEDELRNTSVLAMGWERQMMILKRSRKVHRNSVQWPIRLPCPMLS